MLLIMALYTIGDLHLSRNSDKPMDVFGKTWENHEQKLIQGFSSLTDQDTVVICGDLSWAESMSESLEDFRFLDSLPGKKIILKGNHDFWWSTAAKTDRFFKENGINSVQILHNNSFPLGEYAICGCKGWFYDLDNKLLARECARLKLSLDSAGEKQKLVFLHYPPVFRDFHCDEILELLKSYDVRLCCYGHIHGGALSSVFNSWKERCRFCCVSADYINFSPVKLNLD